MIRWVFIILLSVLLVGGGLFAAIWIIDIQANNNSLQSDLDLLEIQYHNLSLVADSLEDNLSQLQDDYSELQQDYRLLEWENEDLRDELELYDSIPHNYYPSSSNLKYDNTWAELRYYMNYTAELPRSYQEGVFDCSEISAYLEWALENVGFDAYVVAGPTPWEDSGYHAWIIVYTVEYTVAIEATSLEIVYSNDPFCDNYYDGYDDIYRNIYEIAKQYRGNMQEWDWWYS